MQTCYNGLVNCSKTTYNQSLTDTSTSSSTLATSTSTETSTSTSTDIPSTTIASTSPETLLVSLLTNIAKLLAFELGHKISKFCVSRVIKDAVFEKLCSIKKLLKSISKF